MVFGEIKDWQLDPNTKQILVFSCIELKDIFDHSYEDRVLRDGAADASDSNQGAIYKLRATKRIDDTWIAQVFCGITGFSIWEDPNYYESFNKAIGIAAGHLGITTSNACWDLRGELIRTTTTILGEVSKEAS